MHNKLNSKPMFHPNQLRKIIKAKDINSEQMKEVEKSKQTLIHKGIDIEMLNMLEDKLSSFIPNSKMYYSDDKYMSDIISKGQFMYGKGARLIKGELHQCHNNAIDIFYDNKEDCLIATGFAFTQGNVWVEHTWIVHYLDKEKSKYEIIETTIKRTAYFGVILDYYDSIEFAEFCYS